MANSVSLLKPGLSTAVVESLYNEILTGTNNYYYFLGKPLKWNQEDSLISPQDSLLYENQTREGMVFLKKITSSDISFMIPRYDWASGQVFDKYDDAIGRKVSEKNFIGSVGTSYITYANGFDYTKIAIGDVVSGDSIAVGAKVSSIDPVQKRINLTMANTAEIVSNMFITFTTVSTLGFEALHLAKFYCMTSDNNVYKCINNNYGAASTSRPYGTSYSNLTTPDGYVWKYMFTVPNAFANKFMTGNHIPVTTSIKNQYYSNGSIVSATIIDKGVGYQDGDTLVIMGDGSLAENPYRVTDINVDDPGYGYQVVPSLAISDPYSTSPYAINSDVLIGEYLKYGNTIYQVAVSGTTGPIPPTHTSTEPIYNGTAALKFVGLSIASSVTLDNTAVASVSMAGIVGSATVLNPGIGYNANIPPKVTISGSGSGATGYASVINGRVVSIAITNKGSGYSNASITIEPPIAAATATATLNGGSLTEISVSYGGVGYNSALPPTVTITGNGTGATATATVIQGRIAAIDITNGGTGYTTATVTVAPPPATATATATIVGGVITSISVTNGGTGYIASSPPNINIVGDGAGATAGLTIVNGTITAINVINGGSGYTSANVIVDPPGAQASAIPEIYFGYGYSSAPTVVAPDPAIADIIWESSGIGQLNQIVRYNKSFYTITSYNLASRNTFTASNSSVIDITNNTFTFTGHTLTTGKAVLYNTNGGTAIGGLVNNTVYYVIKVDANTIKLATSFANAQAGTAKDITALGVGTGHYLQGVNFDSIPPVHTTGTAVHGDFNLLYSARTALFTAIVQRTQASAVPIIEEGQIVGVIVTNPGNGFTTATINVYGQGEGAEIVPNLSIGDLNTNQGTVELLAVPGTIDSIVITNPGAGYTWAKAQIVGDGQNATASVQIENGSISKITVTNTGSNYTRASIKIIGNSDATPAYARTVISPINGHGRNAVRELFATDIVLSSTIGKDKNQGFIVNNDYRQIGILKNPLLASKKHRFESFTGSACHVITGDFPFDDIVEDMELIDTTSYTIKNIVIHDGGTNYSSPTIVFETPDDPNGVTASGTVIITNGVITEIKLNSIGSGYYTAPTFTITDPTGYGFNGTTILNPEKKVLVVAKPETNTQGGTMSILVQPLHTSTIAVGDRFYINSINQGAEYTVTLVTPPSINKYSGDLLYIDNRAAFTTSDAQTVSIKTTIRL